MCSVIFLPMCGPNNDLGWLKRMEVFMIFPVLPALIFPDFQDERFEQILCCKHLSHILKENLFTSNDIFNNSNAVVAKHHCAIFNSYLVTGLYRNTEPKIDRLGTDVYSQTNETLSPW